MQKEKREKGRGQRKDRNTVDWAKRQREGEKRSEKCKERREKRGEGREKIERNAEASNFEISAYKIIRMSSQTSGV